VDFNQENEVEIIYVDTKKDDKSIIDKVLLFRGHLDKLKTENDKRIILASINWIYKANFLIS